MPPRARSTPITPSLVNYLQTYMVMPEPCYVVCASWVAASWLSDLWDRFPHLAVTSPEKRCGKTRLLQLLEAITPNACNTTSISPAALYRLVAEQRPTLLLDEAQSLKRRGSESSEVLRELLNAGIDRHSTVIRCSTDGHGRIEKLPVYSPKVIALIGDLDDVLADRCLPIPLSRKAKTDEVLPYRSRITGPEGAKLAEELAKWSKKVHKKVARIYDRLEPFPIHNDRLAELLMPLQAILTLEIDEMDGIDGIDGIFQGGGGVPGNTSLTRRNFQNYLLILEEYSHIIDKQESERSPSKGIRLLSVCQEIFKEYNFLPTNALIQLLIDRVDEPWKRWCRGEAITSEALANLLRPYGIHPRRDRKQTCRGYYKGDFLESWERYLPKS